MTSTGLIQRKAGISRTIFVIGIIVVAGVSGVTGYLVNGYLHPQPVGPPSETLNGAGATFPFPFISAVATNYSRIHNNIQINYQAIGSGGGKKALTAKTVDFAASDAPLSATETSGLPAAALTIPETVGAVVVAYNVLEKDGATILPTGLRLDSTTIANIFLGNVVNWNDSAIRSLNPSLASVLPNKAITVVHRSDGSGTTFVFTGYLNSAPGAIWTPGQGQSVSWPVGLGASGNQGVAGVILGTHYTLGYVELAYALTNPMQYSYVQNSDGNTFVKPSLTNVTYAVQNATSAVTLPQGNQSWASVSLLNAKGADSYPITSFTYMLVYKELSIVPGMTQDKAKALVDFLWFTVHSGQAQGPPLAYVQLAPGVVAIDEATIESITFNGQTLPT
jgi:phosphate transport system substrate-binding protein